MVDKEHYLDRLRGLKIDVAPPKPSRPTYGKSIEVAVKRSSRYPDQVEYLTPEEFHEKYKDASITTSTRFVVNYSRGLIEPFAQVYEALSGPSVIGTRKIEQREAEWKKLQNELGFTGSAGNGKLQGPKGNSKKYLRPLEWGENYSLYKTPDKERFTKYAWADPVQAGVYIPELRIRIPSTNSRGFRDIGLWRNDPMLQVKDDLGKSRPMSIKEMEKKWGADKLFIKNENHVLESVAEMRKRGRHEPEKCFAEIKGNHFVYNKNVPNVIVEIDGARISLAMMRNSNAQKERNELKVLDDSFRKKPNAYAIGMLTPDGTSHFNPKFLKERYPKQFEKLRNMYGLPDTIGNNGKPMTGDTIWVQTDNRGIYEPLDQVKKIMEKDMDVGRLLDKLSDTQIMVHNVGRGKILGPPKMLYAKLRDADTITLEVAKELDIGARSSWRDQAFRSKNAKAIDAGNEGDSSDDGSSSKTGTSARRAMLEKKPSREDANGIV